MGNDGSLVYQSLNEDGNYNQEIFLMKLDPYFQIWLRPDLSVASTFKSIASRYSIQFIILSIYQCGLLVNISARVQ